MTTPFDAFCRSLCRDHCGWDDFESDWLAGVERLGTPDARAFADQRRDGYLGGYREVVGFGWLVLTPA
ncbi:MAG TPA: hypothetical protein VN408_16480 [Actinoplanes sp.]|nr:hypothetical protein [Actinoplanes sp.]